MYEEFIRAIKNKLKVQITFFSKEDQRLLTRKCAPMDYGPSRRSRAQNDRFHLWDYESDSDQHSLSLNPEQVRELIVLNESFDPSEFITWIPNWIVPRNWGQYS